MEIWLSSFSIVIRLKDVLERNLCFQIPHLRQFFRGGQGGSVSRPFVGPTQSPILWVSETIYRGYDQLGAKPTFLL
jgi:hypothetical protein